jgi:hypothetical protein
MPWRLRRRLELRLRLRFRLGLGLRLRLELRLGRTCDNKTYRRRQAPNPVQQTNRKPCDKQHCCPRNEDHDSNFQIASLRFVLLDTSRRALLGNSHQSRMVPVGHLGSPPTFIGASSKQTRFSDCIILNTSPAVCADWRWGTAEAGVATPNRGAAKSPVCC